MTIFALSTGSVTSGISIIRITGNETKNIIKKLTRGKDLSEESYRNLIENLPINEVDKTKLLKLTPIQYTGLASYLAKLK